MRMCKLVCAFVVGNALRRFSHDMTHFICILQCVVGQVCLSLFFACSVVCSLRMLEIGCVFVNPFISFDTGETWNSMLTVLLDSKAASQIDEIWL